MKIAGFFAGLVAAATLSVSANATLLTDQQGATGANGGFGGEIVQSFTPAQNNIAGVDVLISGTAALDANVTLEIFTTMTPIGGFAGIDLTGLLVTQTLLAVPRNTTAQFRFGPIGVTPEQLLYMRFQTGLLGVGAFVPGPYSRGDIITLSNGADSGADAIFTTYYDDTYTGEVPVPATALLMAPVLGAIALLGRRMRRRQSGECS